MDEFPDELKEYILNIVRPGSIETMLGQGQESWFLVCQDLIQELQTWHSVYVQLFGLEERLLELITSLYIECGTVPYEKWMTIPDMGYNIASWYNVVLIHLTRLQSWTFFPLRDPMLAKPRLISIGLVNGNHFVQVYNIY